MLNPFAWITERKDVLSGMFFMLSLLSYYYFVHNRFSIGRYALVCVFFALGLMAKPMVVTLPFVLLLLDYWPLRRGCFSPRDAAPSETTGGSGIGATDAIASSRSGPADLDGLLWKKSHSS